MQIVVVSSIPITQLKQDLEKNFGSIATNTWTAIEPKNPIFDVAKSFEFEHRDVPTAYMLAKFPAPGAKDPDVIASALMFEILDQELSEEIRTRRSLSYAVYAGSIRHTLGIGTVGASTSHPKETLEAMVEVIKKLRDKKLTSAKLDEYKNVFATNYFLTQESHESLAGGLATYYFFFKSVDPLYEMPQKLAKVTPEHIQNLANKYLKNMRLGIIYNKDKFDQSWGQNFVQGLLVK
jgi:predicted Zn-dependent peptidase